MGVVWLFSEGNKILTGAIIETKCGAETEGKATQRPFYLGIQPINSHQTLTLLWTTRSAYQKEPVMIVSGVPEPYTYRRRCYQPTIGLGFGSPMEELEGRLEELKGFTAPWEE